MSPTLIRELGLVTVDGGPGRAHSKYVHTDWMTRWNLLGGTRSGSYHDEGRSRSGSATVVFRVRTYLVFARDTGTNVSAGGGALCQRNMSCFGRPCSLSRRCRSCEQSSACGRRLGCCRDIGASQCVCGDSSRSARIYEFSDANGRRASVMIQPLWCHCPQQRRALVPSDHHKDCTDLRGAGDHPSVLQGSSRSRHLCHGVSEAGRRVSLLDHLLPSSFRTPNTITFSTQDSARRLSQHSRM